MQAPGHLGKTLSKKTLHRDNRRGRNAQGLADEELRERLEKRRPQEREDCVDGPRPCLFVSCRYHLFLEVNESGTLRLNFPDQEVWELEETCALDVAERGGVTLEEIGRCLNLTRERARQVQVVSLLEMLKKV
ncbi:MAG: DNA-binding protein [Deltaproteobacteria bacterium]|nr:DNA-binding protein [Deltaproteobacteria bacterium]